MICLLQLVIAFVNKPAQVLSTFVVTDVVSTLVSITPTLLTYIFSDVNIKLAFIFICTNPFLRFVNAIQCALNLRAW